MRLSERWMRIGLAKRAIALVALALLPLGVIAIWQADRIFDDQQRRADRALQSTTERAASRERQIMERAIGAAAAMGNTARSLRNDPVACELALRQFESSSFLYRFAGFYPADGSRACTSGSFASDAGDAQFAALSELRRTGLFVTPGQFPGETAYLVVATPAFESDAYVGHMRVHISLDDLQPAADGLDEERPLGMVTFNAAGEILTSERQLENTQALLPMDAALADLTSETPYAFYGPSQKGEDRAFAIVPLVPGIAYAIGTWDRDIDILPTAQSYWITIALALFMWLASIIVIYLIMHLLVIRGVQRLDHQLLLFRKDRTLPQGAILGRGELYELETSFRDLTETILHDEAELEDAVHEKDVLLKEVHHRVKNNLQLINSIINMILRGARSAETRVVVRRLQDRVMALASVHRSIYQAQTMDRVDASEIVREIVNQSVSIGLPRGSKVAVEMELAKVTLYPDQAMPLSMLVSEGITNALKYVGGDTPDILVRLFEAKDDEAGRREVTLEISNSLPEVVDDEEGTGLGTQLVRAFSHQLEGTFDIGPRDGRHVLEVRFAVASFSPEPQDIPEAAE